MVKICAISDTHNQYSKLTIPPCDILIDCGDYSFKGYDFEIKNFYTWLNKQPAKHKISVIGNHELGFEADETKGKAIAKECCPDAIILQDELVVVEDVKIYGSSYTPYFHNWAYNAGRTITEAAHYKKPFIGDIWAKIPENVDVLASHGPPYNILDELTYVDGTPKGQYVGCVELRKRVEQIKPLIHIFGHIHCAHGEHHENGTSFYNVSVCDDRYLPSNCVTIIELDKSKLKC